MKSAISSDHSVRLDRVAALLGITDKKELVTQPFLQYARQHDKFALLKASTVWISFTRLDLDA